MPLLFDILPGKARALLYELMSVECRRELDELHKELPQKFKANYPTLEEVERDMSEVVGEISPNKTRGIS